MMMVGSLKQSGSRRAETPPGIFGIQSRLDFSRFTLHFERERRRPFARPKLSSVVSAYDLLC
jgi:hypothetical protein